MKVKFQVVGVGETSFTSPKSGRQYNRARLIGMAFDPYDGNTLPGVADLAYDVAAPNLKQGETYLLDCTKMDCPNGMLSFTFRSADPYKASKG